MAATIGNTLESVLESLGMHAVIERFRQERIDLESVLSLSDQELGRLGLTTIGERVRLREKVRHLDKNRVNPALVRNQLFGRNVSSRNKSTKSKTRKRTWTVSVMCLADKNADRTPTGEEKEILFKAGLGMKKIVLCCDDKATDVMQKFSSEHEGFAQLKECGGFELLKCETNHKNLTVIDCEWSVKDLKACIGQQAKIYVRPIQCNLSTKPVHQVLDSTSQLEEKCLKCGQNISLKDLRAHNEVCEEEQQLSNEGNGTDIVYVFAQNAFSDQSVGESSATEQSSNTVILDEGETTMMLDEPAQYIPDDPALYPSELVHNDNSSVDAVVKECAAYCKEQNINDPVNILKIYQTKVVTGRPLELTDETESTGISGETNFILIDRSNIIQTSFDEIGAITDIRKCLEVQFYGESAVDYGGPRKEFFSLILLQLQKEFFDPLREWSNDYEVIGKIMALSTLQNGRLPKLLSDELVQEVFYSDSPRPFVKDLKKGLDSLGLLQLAKELPTVVHLFTASQPVVLTLKMITHLLKPVFSIEGSNRRQFESSVYSMFVKYMREAASGRRGEVSLGSILKFATGTEEEPVLGFCIHPSVHFVERESFIPTGNTCVNRLNLTIPNGTLQMPTQDELFNLYDFAFCNTYFGLH